MEVENDFLIINSQGIVLNPLQYASSGNYEQKREWPSFFLLIFNRLETKKFTPPSLISEKKKPVNVLSYLLEKPYLHTDKSYYYPNETIWFRGYMNYAAPVFKDSLSQVLIRGSRLISRKMSLSRKFFPITNGNAIGSLNIPSTVDGGDYVLRAYTRWILNFDSTLVFVKPLKVLEYTEVGKAIGNYAFQ